ncbi:hypothetical protein [Clostridium celatum]|uniref:hypothetical protein n=1 Tax=Clostridium celatum TaxID=36834 RepID=UPI00189A9E67|nr:hypothetical protein [Clostridium celatum]
MLGKLILKEKDCEILTKGIVSGVGIGILIGVISGEVILLFSLGGVVGIIISSIFLALNNRKNKEL